MSRKRAGIPLAFGLVASWSCNSGEHPERTSTISCDPTSPILFKKVHTALELL